jgi:ATP-binding cassette subfamily C protein
MWSSLNRLVGLLSTRQRGQAGLLVLLLLGNALLEMVGIGLVPVYIGILTEPERVLQNEAAGNLLAHLGITAEELSRQTLLYWGSGLLLGVVTLKLIYTPAMAYLRARYIQGVIRRLSLRLFRDYMRAPYAFHLSRNTSELLRNVNMECIQLGMRVLSPLAIFATQLLVTIGIIALLIAQMPDAALLALLVFIGVSVPLVTSLRKRIRVLAVRAQEGRAHIIRSLQEGLGGIKEVRLLRREDYFVRYFQRALAKVLDLARFQQVLAATLPVTMEWLTIAALLLLVFILFQTAGNEQNVLALAALFAVAMARLKGAVSIMLGTYSQLMSSLVSVDVVAQELTHLEADRPSDVRQGDTKPWQANQGPDSIVLEDVWYRYPEADRHALRAIDLTVRGGEAIGIVGPSGGGKSTLADVILGILPPERGVIKADGLDVHRNLGAWHRLLGYIPQTVYLFDGTIEQNIALGLEADEVNAEAVTKALEAANLSDFVAQLPRGRQTLVGERGVRFSGGQRQRVAIARALYTDPQVLVMDEATSALDYQTEKAVMEAIEALKGQRTLFIVAHRLSTVRACDRIILLHSGAIRAVGTYDDLAGSSVEFQRMLNTA